MIATSFGSLFLYPECNHLQTLESWLPGLLQFKLDRGLKKRSDFGKRHFCARSTMSTGIPSCTGYLQPHALHSNSQSSGCVSGERHAGQATSSRSLGSSTAALYFEIPRATFLRSLSKIVAAFVSSHLASLRQGEAGGEIPCQPSCSTALGSQARSRPKSPPKSND